MPGHLSSLRPGVRMCIACASRNLQAVRSRRNPVTLPSTASTFSRQTQRWQSTDAETTPVNSKISSIVDDIGKLTLLETADLVATLKTRLNIPDLPVGGFAAGPAANTVAAPVEEEEEAAPAAAEKTLFNLKLESFEAGSKPKVIKEVKSMLGLSLVDSKKFVESVPKLMKESVPKEEAQQIIETLKALGAIATMD